MAIAYLNMISVEQYNDLRAAVGWKTIEPSLAQKGLENTAFLIVAYDGAQPVGMARVITDYGYIVFIADVIVHPDRQRQGLGSALMTKVMTYISANIAPGQGKNISLMAAKGKEAFYQRFGFTMRPSDAFGCGMSLWVEKPAP